MNFVSPSMLNAKASGVSEYMRTLGTDIDPQLAGGDANTWIFNYPLTPANVFLILLPFCINLLTGIITTNHSAHLLFLCV